MPSNPLYPVFLNLAGRPVVVVGGGRVALRRTRALARAGAVVTVVAPRFARGSGEAVAQLGAVARQSGVPVSLHGTGGAWLVAGQAADPRRLADVVTNSLDRKVCNTLNVVVVPSARVADVAAVLAPALDEAGARRGTTVKVHVVAGAEALVPPSWFTDEVVVVRADGEHREPRAEPLDVADLGTEWEWEHTPEVSLVVADDLDAAIGLVNRWSPRLVASLVSDDAAEQDRFFAEVDLPFVGDGFTRWVDGQYALGRPELGLSNWENGRLFARGAVLSGDSVYTVRTRMRQTAAGLRR